MFPTDLKSIIRSFDTVLTVIGICHASYVDGLVARSGWIPILIWLANITSLTNNFCCVYSAETHDDGQQISPKYVEFFTKINLRNRASLWLLLKENTFCFMYIILTYPRLQSNLNCFDIHGGIYTLHLKFFIIIVLIPGTALQKPSMLHCTYTMKTFKKNTENKIHFYSPSKFFMKITNGFFLTFNFKKDY